MKIWLSLLLLLLTCSCRERASLDLEFFLGTWKREHKEQYEVWEKEGSLALKGYGFTIKEGMRVISETLSLRQMGDQVMYEARVPDQNDGKAVQFVLQKGIDSLFSFENPNHDFPQKIQYKKLDKDRLKVKVLGEDDRGFSYVQVRQARE